jgi:hypothetical protein
LYGVGEGLPVFERVREGVDLGGHGLEFPSLAGLQHLLTENIPVLGVVPLFRRRLQPVLGLRVQLEDLVVCDFDTMVREDGPQPGDDPALPVDQGTVAVEADDLVPLGV